MDRPWRSDSFADRLAGRRNALGLSRLLLATLVIVSHAFPIGGWGEDPLREWSRQQTDFGELALIGFFAVSGYLITRSALRTDIPTFLWHRCLRILPGFYVALLVTALLVAPWFYARRHGGLEGFWTGADGPWAYLVNNALVLIRQNGIQDVFLDAPYGRLEGASAVNGSLWTLGFEMLCYLMVAIAAAAGVLTRRRILVPLATVACAGLAVAAPSVPLLSGFVATHFFRLAAVFLVGATIASYASSIPFDGRVAAGCLVVAAATALLGGFLPFGYVAVSYLVLWGAGSAPAAWHRVGAVNDLSYGVYIYAWPVQQALAVYSIPRFGYLPYLLTSLGAVLPLAAASWWLVERPAQSLKNAKPWRKFTKQA